MRALSICLLLLPVLAGCPSSGESTAPDGEPLSPYGTFLVIHLAVGNAPEGEAYHNGGSTTSYIYQAYFWPSLVDMVALAQAEGTRLTLLPNVQWFEYILQSDERMELLQEWRDSGHEIGLHHHGYDHSDWDGFSDWTTPGVLLHSKYRGTMTDLLAILEPFGDLVTATPSDRHWDFPTINPPYVYDAAGKGDDLSSARRPPYRVIEGSLDIVQVGMTFHGYDNSRSHLESLMALFDDAAKTDLIGFVTHVHDAARQAVDRGSLEETDFADWLRFLKDRGSPVL